MEAELEKLMQPARHLDVARDPLVFGTLPEQQPQRPCRVLMTCDVGSVQSDRPASAQTGLAERLFVRLSYLHSL